MRIGIDARYDETGIGRYAFRLVSELAALGGEEEYVVFLREGTFRDPGSVPAGVERRLANAAWYSVSEQASLPLILRRARCDLVHFTNFSVPLAYRGRFAVTIHDLTHELRRRLPGDPAGNPLQAAGYRIVLRSAARRAARVIVPSEATRRAIVDRLGIEPERVTVTYEGVDTEAFARPDPGTLARLGIAGPYVLYAGGAHPHKNLPRLLEAFALFLAGEARPHRLVLAGDHGAFGAALRARAAELGLEGRVVFGGRVSDAELAALYRGAACVVLVSLAEGFGLPGLEAMSLGVPVLASSIDSLREVYGDGARFADPLDAASIAAGLVEIAESAELRTRLGERGRVRASAYSWRRTAEETRRIYLECLGEG